MVVGEAVDTGAILVGGESGREEIIEALPGKATVGTACHRAGGTTMIDTPDAKDRFAIGHKESGGVSLIHLSGTGCNHNVAVKIL